jgi:hypothetical protein
MTEIQLNENLMALLDANDYEIKQSKDWQFVFKTNRAIIDLDREGFLSDGSRYVMRSRLAMSIQTILFNHGHSVRVKFVEPNTIEITEL